MQPPGAEGDHHALLDRRPLCRRHPLQGRAAAQREHRLGRDHAVLFVAAAGPGARRRQVARHVARPAGERAVPAGRLAEAPDAATPIGSAARSARIFPRSRRRRSPSAAGATPTRMPCRGWSQGIDAPVKGIVGPWIHKYPHFAVPKPAIGFLQEALRWWDRWLKDIDTGVENDPAMRALSDGFGAAAATGTRNGRAAGSPSRNGRRRTSRRSCAASGDGESLRREAPTSFARHRSPRRRIAAWRAANIARSGSARNCRATSAPTTRCRLCFDSAPLDDAARHRRRAGGHA